MEATYLANIPILMIVQQLNYSRIPQIVSLNTYRNINKAWIQEVVSLP